MKSFFRFFLFVSVALQLNLLVSAQCPRSGNATDSAEKKLNIAKNKSAKFHASQVPQKVRLKTIITSKKENDSAKFFPGAYVVVEGYLVSATEEGPESCNCNKAEKKKKNGDVHMYLALVPDAPKKHSMIVEITPSFKKLHLGYADLLTVGKKVRVYGYLLYDYLHEKNSVNFCQSCSPKSVWRKSCWEIHPVTKIEVVGQ